jgi:hypothetical protein
MSLEVAGREENGKLFVVYSMSVGMDYGMNIFDDGRKMLTFQKALAFTILLAVNVIYLILRSIYGKKSKKI